MSTQEPVIVALTDAETNLAVYLEQLREEGFRVLATSRSYELAVFLTRQPVAGLIARRELLGEPPGDVLRPIKELSPETLIVVTGQPEQLPEDCAPLIDAYLREPCRFSELLEVLEFGRAREEERRRRSTASRPALRLDEEEQEEAGAPLSERGPRVLECVHRLSELERDRELLLTAALEMFLETANAQRASIMLRTADGTHLELARAIGFPDHVRTIEPVPIGVGHAGVVADTGVPMLVESQETTSDRGYGSGSFMIVPLMDRRTAMGVVNITEPRGGAPFCTDTFDMVTTLARHLAISLSNATLLSDLQHMTVIDPLTQLYNRRYFDRQIEVEVQRAQRTRRMLTLALLDIDKFKLVNDFNGYVTGDAVLRQVAATIGANVREMDIVTRWGGDEFALLLPETADEDEERSAASAIERVLGVIRSTDFRALIPGLTGRITLSAGLAAFPRHGGDRSELFRLANQALATAKRRGGNQLTEAHSGTDGHAAGQAGD